MSKITHLNQLENTYSVYRVSGVFEGSRVCTIEESVHFAAYVIYDVVAGKVETVSYMTMLNKLSSGAIKIMCLQRN